MPTLIVDRKGIDRFIARKAQEHVGTWSDAGPLGNVRNVVHSVFYRIPKGTATYTQFMDAFLDVEKAIPYPIVKALAKYYAVDVAACVMECIADGLVNGTGVNQGTGILTGITWNAANSLTFSKTAGLKYADVTKTVAMLKRGYAAGARWAMNNATLYNLFYGLVDANERPIFITDPKQENIGKIMGFDVVVDDNLADEVILFGNFQYMGYNIPEGIVIEVSRDSNFKSGLIDYRALAIADTKPIVPEAFVKLTRATA